MGYHVHNSDRSCYMLLHVRWRFGKCNSLCSWDSVQLKSYQNYCCYFPPVLYNMAISLVCQQN